MIIQNGYVTGSCAEKYPTHCYTWEGESRALYRMEVDQQRWRVILVPYTRSAIQYEALVFDADISEIGSLENWQTEVLTQVFDPDTVV